jgi:ABC-type multidrug transport system ATPase subunit
VRVAGDGREVRVFGMDPQTHGSAIKARLGVVPQQVDLDNEIAVRENLLMYARCLGGITGRPVLLSPLPRIVIELLPLYHGTAMLRQLTTGAVDHTHLDCTSPIW